MSKFKAVLFDVDGVLLQPPKYFSHHYAEQHGIEKFLFDEFFGKHSEDVVTGKTDYKKLISENEDLWKWREDPQELLDIWFEFENHPNQPLLKVVTRLRKQGVSVYLATNQEKNRGIYLRTKLFANKFDGAFISSQLGYGKQSPEFFSLVLKQLKMKVFKLKPSEVVFFDDVQEYVDSARSQGIDGRLYENVEEVKKYLTS